MWRAGGDQLVGLEHDVGPGRLGRLLAGREVRLVDAQDLHELDAGDRVDDAVQLALVERAAERPAAGRGRSRSRRRAGSGTCRARARRPPRRARCRRSGAACRSTTTDSPRKRHGSSCDRRADQPPLVEVLRHLAHQAPRRAAARRRRAGGRPGRRAAAGAARTGAAVGAAGCRPRAPPAATPRRPGTRSPRRSPRGSASGSPSPRAGARARAPRRRRRRWPGSGFVTVSTPGIALLSTVSVARPRRCPRGRRRGGSAVKRSTAPFGGTAPYCVQPPSVSRIAGPSSTSPADEVEREVAVELGRADEVLAQLPGRPVAGLGVLHLERLAPRAA